MNKNRLNELREKLEKVQEVYNTFKTYCNNQSCQVCPLRNMADDLMVSCRDLLFKKPKEISPIIFPKTFGEEILEAFPSFDFEQACVQSFFKGKDIKEFYCQKYKTCESHYMSKTREEILEELQDIDE